MDKPQVENLERRPPVEPLPLAIKTEAGVLLNVEAGGESALRLAKDGHTVLLPQPTDDPSDPLNWPSWKRHSILFTVAWGAFCADFTSASGSAPPILQAEVWHQTVAAVNQTNSINVLMMAVGGLLWVPMSSFMGRAPTLFWSTVGGLIFSIATALSPSFECFFAMRALTGFFITSAQTISIAFIKDMFFMHERARKIGLWALLYIASPYWGPLLANFVLGATSRWENIFWVCVGAVALDLCLIVAFLDETWYNREIPGYDQPSRGGGFLERMSRVVGIWGLRHHHRYYETAYISFRRFFSALFKPALFLILVAYLLFFAWAIGINITTAILFALPRDLGGYGYSYTGIGFLYFSPIIGILLGEIFGHFANDYLARRYVRKHNGVFEPEARLPMIYISGTLMAVGLIVIGQALAQHLSIGAIIMGWGMNTFGLMTASVAVSAYVLDSFPTAPAEVSGWTNFSRAIGGFGVGYFQQPWGDKVGYGASFGTQASVVVFGLIITAVVHRYGHSLRLHSGPIR